MQSPITIEELESIGFNLVGEYYRFEINKFLFVDFDGTKRFTLFSPMNFGENIYPRSLEHLQQIILAFTE